MPDQPEQTPQPNGSTPPAKAKRKPVAVAPVLVAKVSDVIQSLPTNLFTIQQIREDLNNEYPEPEEGAPSAKAIGAALRQLVAEGKASETPRGRFRAVAQPAVADGAEQ
jgi:hypothetical protein